MNLILQDVFLYTAAHQLEAAGAIAGLLCVWMLMRQSLWTWPFGILYALISVYIFWGDRLYGQLVLHAYFIAMNLYGWYHWVYGRAPGEDLLPVTRVAPRVLMLITLASGTGALLLAIAFDHFTGSTLPYLDFSLTVLSIAAMWLQARKALESWVFWIVVDLGYGLMFLLTQNYFYLLLYLVYIPMAFEGYFMWRRASLLQPASSV